MQLLLAVQSMVTSPALNLSQVKLSDLATCSPSSTVRLDDHVVGDIGLPGKGQKTVGADDRSDFTQIRPVSALFAVCYTAPSLCVAVAAV